MKKLFTSVCLCAAAFLGTGSLFAQLNEFSDNDREYYLIYVDDDVVEDNLKANPKNVIVQDLRVDDNDKHLYIWSDTYSAPTGTGKNFYGGFTGYLNLQVENVGWSGTGFAASATYMVDFTKLNANHTFHIALKSTARNSHLFFLWGGSNLNGAVCIGTDPYVDGAKTYQPVAEFTRDGQWHLVEVPMSKFIDAGFLCPEPFGDGNYFSFLSGNNPGAVISMDAIFIYGPASGNSINENKADESISAIVTNNVVTFLGTDRQQAIELFNMSGQKVVTLDEPIIGVDQLAKGVYVAKCGNATTKFIIK